MTSSEQREPYLSDLSDARCALMEPTLTAWRAERQKTSLNLGGKVTDLREVMNAILFLNRTGVPWRYLPNAFPLHTTVFGYFSSWTADGTIEKLGLRLHRMVREQAGRTAEPTACVIDAQSVKTATSVPTDTQGTDAGKKIVGRKGSVADLVMRTAKRRAVVVRDHAPRVLVICCSSCFRTCPRLPSTRSNAVLPWC